MDKFNFRERINKETCALSKETQCVTAASLDAQSLKETKQNKPQNTEIPSKG